MANKKRVFIAEDNQAILESLEKLLLLSGFEVKAISDARQALSTIKVFMPDVVLLDLIMPNLGGIEICQMLNVDKQTNGIPIIVLSALDKQVDIKKAYELGIVAYIIKPYDFSVLLKEINKAIQYKEEKRGG